MVRLKADPTYVGSGVAWGPASRGSRFAGMGAIAAMTLLVVGVLAAAVAYGRAQAVRIAAGA